MANRAVPVSHRVLKVLGEVIGRYIHPDAREYHSIILQQHPIVTPYFIQHLR